MEPQAFELRSQRVSRMMNAKANFWFDPIKRKVSLLKS